MNSDIKNIKCFWIPLIWSSLGFLIWIWMSVLFPRLGNFSAIMSLNKFSAPFSFFSSGMPVMQIVGHLVVFPKILKLCSLFFKFFFLFSPLIGWIPLLYLQVSCSCFHFIETAVEPLFWVFLCSYHVLQLCDFHLVLSQVFNLLVEILILSIICSCELSEHLCFYCFELFPSKSFMSISIRFVLEFYYLVWNIFLFLHFPWLSVLVSVH